MENVCEALAASPDEVLLVNEYDRALKNLDRAQQMEGTRLDILSGFQLEDIPQDTLIESLSGGQKVRLALAGILLEGPHVLLLDEPTNHLDLASQEAFESALSTFEGTILAIAHDRYFIDRFAQFVWVFSDDGISVELMAETVHKIMSS